MSAVHVLRTGPQCLVEDLGRPGLAGQGVTLSGAADRAALIAGNRALGNSPGAPGLELLLGDLAVRPDTDVLVAVTGAWCPLDVDGTPADFGGAVLVPAGAALRVGRCVRGLRSYLTVRGGLVPDGSFAGSWSTDTSSGIGPRPVRAGDTLPVGDPGPTHPLAAAVAPSSVPPDAVSLPLVLGPRPDALSPAAQRELAATVLTVRDDSDRIGVRLGGFAPTVPPVGASEPIVLGAVQAPPGGELIVFGVDHPTTGGYPVIGVVPAPDLDRLAQCAPGTRVRFEPVAPALTAR